uniref:Uncharacterized protein n=1 Tax=Caenorhabditis japonica TaxID=281687 RepID=A0A8R1IJL8_CAEJA
MSRAPLHTVAEQAQSFVMHQLGSSLHMLSRYVLSNNRSTSCDCIVHCLLTNRKIELRTNVAEALWRIGDDPNDVPFIAGVATHIQCEKRKLKKPIRGVYQF